MIRNTSFLKLLLACSGVALLVTNCVVKSSSDSCVAQSALTCTCADGRSGQKTCNDQGTDYGACQCGAGTAGSGGSSSTAGTGGVANGGAATAGTGGATTAGGTGNAGEAGAGDMAGAAGAAADDCDACIFSKCAKEFAACQAEKGNPNGACLSDPIAMDDQYVQVISCVDDLRVTKAVKRADLVACGNSVGSSGGVAWPPAEMTPATRDLINCMATGTSINPGDEPNNGWSDSNVSSTPWAANSCAKIACTSLTN